MRSLLSVPFYTSHDGFTHTARIAAYYQTLADGQFPPRWAGSFNGQLGSPIFVYSYPLVYFLGALLHSGGISYESAFRAVMIAGYLLSGIGAYFWLSRKFSRPAGLVGAIFYLWVPYHFLNVYVRAAVAENLAYAFLPFAFLAMEEIYRSARLKLWFFVLVFSVTATLLSHNLVSAIAIPIFVCWSIIWGWKKPDKNRWLANVLGLVVPFFLAAFIYVPDIFERNFIRFDQGISYFADHFVSFWQLLRSPWGYGFDLPGTVNDAMSFQIGLAHLLVVGLVVILIFYKVIKDKKFLIRKENSEAIFLIGLFVMLLLLMIEHSLSRTLWQTLPVVKTIVDFPWRLLGLVTVIIAYFAGYLVWRLRSSPLVAIILLAAVLVANRNFLRINEAVSFGDAAYENYTGTSTAASSEYTPVWHRGLQFPVATPRVDWVNPTGVKILASRTDLLEFAVASGSAKEARINRFYFPDTEIYRDGKLLTQGADWSVIMTRTQNSTFDDSGTIRLNVDRGGEFRLLFKETLLRDFANKISLTTLVTLVIYALF